MNRFERFIDKKIDKIEEILCSYIFDMGECPMKHGLVVSCTECYVKAANEIYKNNTLSEQNNVEVKNEL